MIDARFAKTLVMRCGSPMKGDKVGRKENKATHTRQAGAEGSANKEEKQRRRFEKQESRRLGRSARVL